MKLDWSVAGERSDFELALAQFQRYLVDNGFRQSTIDSYLECAEKYLEFAKTDKPLKDMAEKFRASLHARKLSRSTINNYCSAIKNYSCYARRADIIPISEAERIDPLLL